MQLERPGDALSRSYGAASLESSARARMASRVSEILVARASQSAGPLDGAAEISSRAFGDAEHFKRSL